MMLQFEPIGIFHSCFKDKFGIPRQSGLAKGAKGFIKLNHHSFFLNAIRELDSFSHIWVIFVFHQTKSKSWKPSIRPPRLGGAKKVGVLASRSPHRPNPIGLSAMKLEQIIWDAQDGAEIHVSGVDILDGSPVLDIKPYLPYADRIEDARSGWAAETIKRTPVIFETTVPATLQDLIREVLELDPRPAFQKRQLPADSEHAQGTHYGFQLFDFDVKWKIQGNQFHVIDLVDLKGLTRDTQHGEKEKQKASKIQTESGPKKSSSKS